MNSSAKSGGAICSVSVVNSSFVNSSTNGIASSGGAIC
ncbi:hypothetical protein [Methanobrevibacter oralis]